MKRLNILFIIIAFFSCTESTEFDNVKVDFSKLHKQMPVVLSLFSPDSVLQVNVGSTLQAFDRNDEPDSQRIENAIIEIPENDIRKTLTRDSINKKLYFSDLSLAEGKVYKINLDFPDITDKPVSGTDTIPFGSKIKSISIIPEAKNVDDNLLTLIRIEISPSIFQQKSNYEISVITEVTDSIDDRGYPLDSVMLNPNYRRLSSDDPLITGENYYPSILQFDAFPPERLYFKKEHNKENFQIEFYYDPPAVHTTFFSEEGEKHSNYIFSHSATIYLKTISENYYKYHVSRLTQFYSREGDPLYGVGSPVIVHSNIQNGIGIFAAYTTEKVKTTYPEQ